MLCVNSHWLSQLSSVHFCASSNNLCCTYNAEPCLHLLVKERRRTTAYECNLCLGDYSHQIYFWCIWWLEKRDFLPFLIQITSIIAQLQVLHEVFSINELLVIFIALGLEDYNSFSCHYLINLWESQTEIDEIIDFGRKILSFFTASVFNCWDSCWWCLFPFQSETGKCGEDNWWKVCNRRLSLFTVKFRWVFVETVGPLIALRRKFLKYSFYKNSFKVQQWIIFRSNFRPS